MAIKYAIRPGYIRSRHDGQRHHIGPGRLAQLYGVSFSECIVIPEDDPCWGGRFRGYDLAGLVHLYPRYDGDYRLARATPTEGEE